MSEIQCPHCGLEMKLKVVPPEKPVLTRFKKGDRVSLDTDPGCLGTVSTGKNNGYGQIAVVWDDHTRNPWRSKEKAVPMSCLRSANYFTPASAADAYLPGEQGEGDR